MFDVDAGRASHFVHIFCVPGMLYSCYSYKLVFIQDIVKESLLICHYSDSPLLLHKGLLINLLRLPSPSKKVVVAQRHCI